MEMELHRQRRNVIGVSLALIIFEIAGGTVKDVSFLNGGIKLDNAELIVSLSYIALTYLLWRYWLYAKLEHTRFRGLIKQKIKESKKYQELVNPLIDQFKNNSGVAHAEGWQDAVDDDEKKEFIPIPVEVSLQQKMFSRELVIRVDNSKGDYHHDQELHRIGLLRYEAIRFKAWVAVVAADKAFSDLFVPYLLAFSAAAALCFRVIYA